MTKSNRTRSPQRDYSTLRSIHAKQRQYRLLYRFKLVFTHKHLTDHNMTCCQCQERSPLHNLSSCEVSTWFITPQNNYSKLSCQKHKKYLVYSHAGGTSLEDSHHRSNKNTTRLIPTLMGSQRKTFIEICALQ